MAGNVLVNALVASLCLFSGGVSSSPVNKREVEDPTLDEVAKQALTNAYKVLDGTLSDGTTRSSECTKDTVAVRQEFGDLTHAQRIDYTDSVLCLLNKPSKLPAGMYPGAKSRYEDFVVVHMNMTPAVHGTANFMHWHRYYIWAYETALRTECGYKGYQPYWDWSKYPDLVNSPVFNGDEWSMGGNGEPVGPHADLMFGPEHIIPAGPGGGCVTTGPFANLTIHLGPLAPTVDPQFNIPPNPQADGYGDNPRCLRRDVNNAFTKDYMRPQDLLDQIVSSKNIFDFQESLQSNGTTTLSALHVGGHFSIWGDPGGDVYVSPAEPAFWLHHSQLDRHWWMWAMYQESEVKDRTLQYQGATNWFVPDGPRGKPEDEQELDVVAPEGMNHLPSKDLFSTTSGPFCYVYA
ncbi:Di-copper centre-containing protein [Decorospora gaudefroyi]|uniref:Di-copper centre-containing protein n=1 Tax=Decorospora gaudefroyi TaxID=184978 RepID=A0A6A5K094_9PLEO|nr:Di-copper centre-containing protein [Decorospora gaudefroyi]